MDHPTRYTRVAHRATVASQDEPDR
jgi:hypothetical protein